MTIKEIRDMTGLSRMGFAKKYGIPYRTLMHWEMDERKPPEYVLGLLMKVILLEKEEENEKKS